MVINYSEERTKTSKVEQAKLSLSMNCNNYKRRSSNKHEY